MTTYTESGFDTSGISPDALIDMETGLDVASPLGPQVAPGAFTEGEGARELTRLLSLRQEYGIGKIDDKLQDIALLQAAAVLTEPKAQSEEDLPPAFEPNIPARAKTGVTPVVRKTREPKKVGGTRAMGKQTITVRDVPKPKEKPKAGMKAAEIRDMLTWETKGIDAIVMEHKAPGGSNGPAPGASAALNRYWTRGAGLAKWAGTPTPFRSLVRALKAKGVPAKMVNGLAATYYHQVKGKWPGKRGGGKK